MIIRTGRKTGHERWRCASNLLYLKLLFRSFNRPFCRSPGTSDLRPTAAEPFMPAEGTEVLENLAFDLAREASELSGLLHPVVRLAVGDLVRSMNCYYSNLIEGHNTHPRDIDRALVADYSADPHRRDLQLEARAHIEVQRMIDERTATPAPPASRAIHRMDASRVLHTHA